MCKVCGRPECSGPNKTAGRGPRSVTVSAQRHPHKKRKHRIVIEVEVQKEDQDTDKRVIVGMGLHALHVALAKTGLTLDFDGVKYGEAVLTPEQMKNGTILVMEGADGVKQVLPGGLHGIDLPPALRDALSKAFKDATGIDAVVGDAKVISPETMGKMGFQQGVPKPLDEDETQRMFRKIFGKPKQPWEKDGEDKAQ